MQSTATLPTVLITQHTNLAFVIPAQPVGAEPPITAVIDGSNRTFANYGRPDQSINLLDRLDGGLDNTQSPTQYSDVTIIPNGLNIL